MKAETEIWQVETRDGLYQADLPTLKQWVAEGIVLPTDRVRKGAFRWIEAQHAPGLRLVFFGEEYVEIVAPPPQAEDAVTAAPPPEAPPVNETSPDDMGLPGDDEHFQVAEAPLGSSCHFHPTQAATVFCRSCQTTFCRACPNRIGTSSVQLCTLCGGFCDPIKALNERADLYRRQSEGFGFGDFQTALKYPFKHLASLLGGALLYGLLLLAGMRAHLLASALLFGCISLVVRRVAYGNLKRDFLPDFSEFSFWDDVVVPCALGIGVTVVTLGPMLVLVFVLIFGWLSGPGSQLVPASPLAQAAEGREMKDGLPVTREDVNVLIEGGTEEQKAEAARKLRTLGPDVQKLEESRLSEESAAFYVYRLMAGHPWLVLVLALLALGWAVFYYPMALLVAGWTESLKSVLNPLVGLDTIRHMGANYFKAFGMYLVVQLIGFVLQIVVAILTLPFNLSFIGNLPGTFLGGVVTFYTSLVVACVLGLALFKSADRFGIQID